jgi:hypothetical protein
MQTVQLGRYKVAFWNASNPSILYSKMFDSLDSALLEVEALESADYLCTVMEIKVIGNGAYTWEVLDVGVGKHLPLLTKLYKYKIPIGIAVIAFIS